MLSFNLSAYGDTEALRALGDGIRKHRLSRDLTQDHMAALLGVSLPTYRKVERGEGAAEIRHYARALAVLGFAERLRDLVPTLIPPPDPAFLASMGRQRARRKRRSP